MQAHQRLSAGVGRPGRRRAASRGKELSRATVTQADEVRANAATTRVRVRAGEELDLVLVSVAPDVGEADDFGAGGDEERVERWIGASEMKAGNGIVRRRAGDALVGECALVQKDREQRRVGVRCRTRLELGQEVPFGRRLRRTGSESRSPRETGSVRASSEEAQEKSHSNVPPSTRGPAADNLPERPHMPAAAFSKINSSPSISSICEPTSANPALRMSASDGSLSG